MKAGLIAWIVVIIILGVLSVLLVVNIDFNPTGAAVGIGNDEIILGSVLPLTGDISSLGQGAKSAMEIAVREINNKGGINGKKLKIIYEDGNCNAKEAANAANKLINIIKVPVIVGGVCSSETLAMAPLAEASKTVLFSPCSSAPSITNAGDYIFRSYPSDDFEGNFGAEFVYNELGIRKVATMTCLSDWCVGINRVFEKSFKELGGDIVEKEEFEQGSKDLRTQLTKIKKSNPELIYFISYTESAIAGLEQIRELNIDAKVLGANTFDDPNILKRSKESGEGTMFSILDSDVSDEFKAKIKKQTGSEDIPVCTTQGYDNIYILVDIIERVGLDSEKIKNEIYKVKNYQGVSGVLTFDENGDVLATNYVIKIYHNNKAIKLEDYEAQ